MPHVPVTTSTASRRTLESWLDVELSLSERQVILRHSHEHDLSHFYHIVNGVYVILHNIIVIDTIDHIVDHIVDLDLIYHIDIIHLHNNEHNIEVIPQAAANSISSTVVRRQLTSGGSVKYLMPDACADYVREHQLDKLPQWQ